MSALGVLVAKAAGDHLVSFSPMGDNMAKGISVATTSSLWAPHRGGGTDVCGAITFRAAMEPASGMWAPVQ